LRGFGLLVCVVAFLVVLVPASAENPSDETNMSYRAGLGTQQPTDAHQGISGGGVPLGGRVAAFTDLAETVVIELALELLSVEYELFHDEALFSAALEAEDWDLAIVELPLRRHDCDPMVRWVENGGRLIASMWQPSPELAEAMDASLIGNALSSALPVHSWDISGALFSGVQQLPSALVVSEERWGSNGYRLEPQGEAIALAGFAADRAADQAAIVLGNEGRTLLNGFLFSDYEGTDGDADGLDDIVELVANQVAHLLGAEIPTGSIVERPLQPGVPADGEIAGSGFEWTEGALSGYLQYSISIPTAWALSIRVVADCDVDLFVRVGRPIDIRAETGDGWIARYSLAAVSSSAEEHLVISEPVPGSPYWIAVANKEEGIASYTLEANVAPVIEDLTLRDATGEVGSQDTPLFLHDFLTTPSGVLSLEQYRFTLPRTGEAFSIRVEGSGAWRIHLRAGSPVTAGLNAAISDVAFLFTDAAELAVGSSLPPGDYYLALEALSPPQSYRLSVAQ